MKQGIEIKRKKEETCIAIPWNVQKHFSANSPSPIQRKIVNSFNDFITLYSVIVNNFENNM